MPGKITEGRNNYGFPYQSTTATGGTNNGGFDLSTNPECIDRITEAQDFPELLNALMDIGSRKHFKTLGCDKKFTPPSSFMGYLEICFRRFELMKEKQHLHTLISCFYDDSPWAASLDIEWDISGVDFATEPEMGYKLSMAYYIEGKPEPEARVLAGQLLTAYSHFLTVVFVPGHPKFAE
jgi:hypothetical protein